MRNLNAEQRSIVEFHIRWCKEVVQCTKQKQETPKPYHLYISGPGGVGKSHVISLLRHITMKYLRHLPDVTPDDVLCLLCAPTGTAAFNIDGMTIHSAFFVPIAMKEYRNLGAETLNTLRNRLLHLKVLIVDEISMVSATMLYYIHRRLEEIKGSATNYSLFGGVTVIAVGDLYQLKPVQQSFVFGFPDDAYAKLCDPLWYQFKFAELSQMMKSKD
jgi:DNA replication protein DnaC